MSNDPEYVEDDLGDIFEEIDQMDRNELLEFEKEINELMAANDSALDDDDIDEADDLSFSNMSLDFRRRPLARRNVAEESLRIESPIRTRPNRKHRLSSRSVDFHIAAHCLDEQEEMMRAYDPESHDLMNKAAQSMADLYKIMDDFDVLEREVFGETEPHEDAMGDVFQEEEKENASDQARREVEITAEVEATERGTKRDPSQDKRLRPVFAPEPGRAPYRHDPVNTYHMYQQEWKRRPTPEEEKRLALRWKVRDLMLKRRFAPRHQPTGEPVQHDKDWSPRPYMD